MKFKICPANLKSTIEKLVVLANNLLMYLRNVEIGMITSTLVVDWRW